MDTRWCSTSSSAPTTCSRWKKEWGLSSTNRRVRTYQITAAGLRRLEQQISSFERMFEGIALVLDPGKSPVS
jgi:DNA-binding PadR family transcriptional regulator